MSANLAVRQDVPEIVVSSMTELQQLAKASADTQFFGAKTPQQALVLMLAGRDLGFSYMQSLRSFHVINGKPSLTADAMVAICLARKDLCAYFRRVSESETEATWETQRVGDPSPTRSTFTLAEAKTAGLLGNAMWSKYPKRMLSARAKAFLARDVYPELLAGFLEEGEAQGIVEGPRAVETVATVVDEAPPARPTPPPASGPREAPVRTRLDDACEAQLVYIENALDLVALDGAAAAVKALSLPAGEWKTKLGAAYVARRKALTAPPPEAPPAEQGDAFEGHADG